MFPPFPSPAVALTNPLLSMLPFSLINSPINSIESEALTIVFPAAPLPEVKANTCAPSRRTNFLALIVMSPAFFSFVVEVLKPTSPSNSTELPCTLILPPPSFPLAFTIALIDKSLIFR